MITPPIASHVREPAFFYGWVVVAAAFAVTFVGFGSAYTFSAFLDSLQSEFGASRGSVSLVFSLAGCLYFGFGVASGPLADRFGARRLVLAGMLLVGVAMIAAACARTLAQVYLAYGAGIGLGIGCSYVPMLGVVQRWFVRRRAFASGLAVSGTGLGTLLMPLVAVPLIRALGWRHAYLLLGLAASIVGVGVSRLVVNDPGERGLRPDGDAPRAAAPAPAEASTGSVLDVVRSRGFVWLYATCLFCSVGLFVPFVHLAPFAMDHGLDRQSAAALVSVIGVGSTAGRFLLGLFADRWPRQSMLTGMFAGMALAFAFWARSSSAAEFIVFALLYGAFYGGFVAILPALVMDAFGGRYIASLLGVLYTSVALGTLLGPSAVGFVFDRTHDYAGAIVGCACAMAIAAAMSSATGWVLRGRRWRAAWQPQA